MGRTAIISKASIVGIIWNLILVAMKAFVGFVSGSIAVTADALNNLTDALSAIITLFGARMAGKQPDREHPYGHGRLEYVTSVIVAALILYAGVQAFWDAIQKIIHPGEPDYDALTLTLLAVAVVVKIFLSRYFKRQGQCVDSHVLSAVGTDAALDAVVSGSILIGAVVTMTTSISIDGWLGVAVAVLILKSGLDIFREGLSSIIGERVSKDVSQKLKEEIGAFPCVQGVYDLMVHRYGPESTIASVHVVLPDDMTVSEADAICRQIAADIFEKHNILLTVGIYAANTGSPEAQAIQQTLLKLVSSYPEILQVHGFYVDTATRRVSFDILMDFGCEDPERIQNDLVTALKEAYPRYDFSTTIDRDISD